MFIAYGPNSAAIEHFIARVAQLDPHDFESVVGTWCETMQWRHAAWYEAEDAVGEAIARTRRDDAMWRLEDALYRSFRGGAWYQRPSRERAGAASEAAAQYVATSAAVALMVADVLEPHHLAALYSPFAAVIPRSDLMLAQCREGRKTNGSPTLARSG